jgi:hypothetical protein
MMPAIAAELELTVASATSGASREESLLYQNDGKRVLFGMIDGASRELALRWRASVGDLRDRFSLLIQQVRRSTGSSALICLVESGKLWAAGMGSLQLCCTGAQVNMFAGRQLRFHVAHLPRGARLVLFSDGVSRADATALGTRGTADDACHRLLAPVDGDAAVMVVDVR